MAQEIRPIPSAAPDSYTDMVEASYILREQIVARDADKNLIEAKAATLDELRKRRGDRTLYIERLESHILSLAKRPQREQI